MHVGMVLTPALLLALLEVAFQVLEELLATDAIEAGSGMTVPITYHQIAEEHTAQMGRMSHTVTRGTKGREELNGHITQHEPFGFDGEWKRNDEETLVRKGHTKSQNDSINGTRGADGGPSIQGIGIMGAVLHHSTEANAWYLLGYGHVK